MTGDPARMPQVWVDADACPGPVKEILFRAAERARVPVTLVANQWLRTPSSHYVRALQVQGGFDVADDAIAERAGPGDLVVTQDIPLAARVLAKGAAGHLERAGRRSGAPPQNLSTARDKALHHDGAFESERSGHERPTSRYSRTQRTATFFR